MEDERPYLDFKVKTHMREVSRRALKMGLLLASFDAVALSLSFLANNILGVIAFAIMAGGMTAFGAWTIGYITAQETIDFVQELYREHREAMARS